MELSVKPLVQRFEGYGIVAVDRQSLRRLAIESGSFVGLHTGDGETEADTSSCTQAVQVATGTDAEGIVALDNQTRATLGVTEGDTVSVDSLTIDDAHRVTVTVDQPTVAADHRRALRARLKHRIVAPGDQLSVPVPDAPDGEIGVKIETTRPGYRVGTQEFTSIEFTNLSSKNGADTADEASASGADTAVEGPTYADVGGLDDVVRELRDRVQRPLSEPERFERLGITPPTGVILHGPPGTGKTLLARALANEIDATFEAISAGEVLTKWFGESESNLRSVFETARSAAPAVVYIDEIDALSVDRSAQESPLNRVVNELLTQMDGLEPSEQVVVVGSTNRIGAIDPALRRPGRFDRELKIDRPDERGRCEILKIHTRETPLAERVDLEAYARRTNGWTGADLAQLVREATLAALRRSEDETAETESVREPDGDYPLPVDGRAMAERTDMQSSAPDSEEVCPDMTAGRTVVTDRDLQVALETVSPAGVRQYAVYDPDVTWAEVGGLTAVERTLREIVEWPRQYPEAFDAADLDPATGVLLYGPPGTGKTLAAKALASSTDATFLTVSGAALLSGRPSETQRRIHDLFETARAHAPSVVFFDEFDALVGQRTEDATTAGDQIVAQFLTELEGKSANGGVTVVAATNRLDAIDDAILRSGRFDEQIHVGVPDEAARREILEIHTDGRAVSDAVDLDRITVATDRCSGADLAALCRQAARSALRRTLKDPDGNPTTEHQPATPTLTPADFTDALESTVETPGDGRVQKCDGVDARSTDRVESDQLDSSDQIDDGVFEEAPGSR